MQYTHIDYIPMSESHISIMQGSIERDPVYHTIYWLTQWLAYDISSSISNSLTVWGAWDELSINNWLLKDQWLCILSKLHDRCLSNLHKGHVRIEKMQHSTSSSIYCPGIYANFTMSNNTQHAFSIIPKNHYMRQQETFPKYHGKKLTLTYSHSVRKTTS